MDQVVATAQEALDRRLAAHRTNVMLAGSVEACGRTFAVRIRNLSATGALIESQVIPSKDTQLVLCRDELKVEGVVVWCRDNRFGLRFSETIDVAGWIKPGNTILPTGSIEQQRVDRIQQDARAGLAAATPSPIAAAKRSMIEDKLKERLAEELKYVQRIIEGIGDEFAGEPIVVGRHHAALQKFDLACQILGQLARILTAEDPVDAASSVGMQDLRSRLLRS